MIGGDAALVGERHRNSRPVERMAAERGQERRRGGAAWHRQRGAAGASNRRLQHRRDLAGQKTGQRAPVRGLDNPRHAATARQRRPSRCISISASSGPDE